MIRKALTKRVTRAVGILFAAILLTQGSARGAEKEPIKLILADMLPPTSISGKCIRWWGDEVEKRTNGQVKFEYYFGASLVGAFEQMDSLKSNVVQVATYLSSYHPDVAPVTAMGAFPMLNTGSLESALKASDEWLRTNEQVKEEFKKNNVKYLNPLFGADAYMWSKVPVNSIADFQGLSVRAFGPWLAFFDAMGSSVVSVPVPEIYNTLERGVVKATLLFLTNGVSLNLYEVTHYLNTSNLGHLCGGGLPLVMNLDVWNGLPEDVKNAIEEIDTREAVANYVRLYEENKTREMQVVKDKGMVLSQFSPEDVEKMRTIARDKVWQPYVKKLDEKGLHGSEALEDWIRIINKYK